MPFSDEWQTLPAVLFFAAVFLFGGRLYSPISIIRRNALSLGAGASVAYIFIMLLPELENAGDVFRASSIHLALPYQGRYGLHLATMLGFLIFYGLNEMVTTKQEVVAEPATGVIFWAHMLGFGSYAWLTCFLLLRTLGGEESSLLIYAIAMGFHFLLCAHSLCEEHGVGYDRVGRWLLAACTVGGWFTGLLLDLPKPVIVILFGIIAGGVLVNTMIMELPRKGTGKFFPFLVGACTYAALLIV